MPKVIKPGTGNQPGGTYIEVQRSGNRVQGGRVIEIEQGGDIAANTEP